VAINQFLQGVWNFPEVGIVSAEVHPVTLMLGLEGIPAVKTAVCA